MNRAQRRHPPKIRQAPKESLITTSFGHDGNKVVIAYSQKINNISLNEIQCEEHITNLTKALQMLRTHKAEALNG